MQTNVKLEKKIILSEVTQFQKDKYAVYLLKHRY